MSPYFPPSVELLNLSPILPSGIFSPFFVWFRHGFFSIRLIWVKAPRFSSLKYGLLIAVNFLLTDLRQLSTKSSRFLTIKANLI